MKTLKVIEVVGSAVLLHSDKGDHLKKAMQEALRETSQIAIDFAGYQFLSTMFLNFSFGALCLENDWSREEFFGHITIQNLAEDDGDDVELSLRNAQQRRELRKNNIDTAEFYERNVLA